MPRPVVRTQRREQIVQACLRLVRQTGIHGFTVADVAAEAGVSRGILHYHFVSKEEIVREALLVLLLEFGRRAAETVSTTPGAARARLHALVDAALNEGQLDFYATLLEFWSPARRDAVHRAALGRLYDGWIGFIAGLIRQGQAAGDLGPPTARPEDLACTLVALCDGLMVQCLIRREWMPVERARAIMHRTVDSLFPAAHETTLPGEPSAGAARVASSMERAGEPYL